jgi:hypothetical protein
LSKSVCFAILLLFMGSAIASADCIISDLSSVSASFGGTKDRVTIAPGGAESLADAQITIRVVVKNGANAPFVGIPAEEIVLWNPSLCICPGGGFADAPTNIDGVTTFTGTIRAGGCAEYLSVFVTGVYIGDVPVKTNSFDTVSASPCAVDASDLAELASRLGSANRYTACLDYNESGPPTIDASDLAALVSALGTSVCR